MEKNKVKEITLDKKDLKNKNVLAEGYKVFKNDWSTKHGNYCYADENGNVVGTFHKVDGNIEECKEKGISWLMP